MFKNILNFIIKNNLIKDFTFFAGLIMLAYGLWKISDIVMYCVIGGLLFLLSIKDEFNKKDR